MIPEYGRNVQKMVEIACTLKEKKERTDMAHAIIQIMGRINSNFKTGVDDDQKLWHHLFAISNYKLDVESPFTPPIQMESKPINRMPYPNPQTKYKYYGKTIENLIKAAKEFDEGAERDYLCGIIANLMKKAYLLWNRSSVDDNVISEQLRDISEGKLKLRPDFIFESSASILARNKTEKSLNSNKRRNRSGSKNRRRRR